MTPHGEQAYLQKGFVLFRSEYGDSSSHLCLQATALEPWRLTLYQGSLSARHCSQGSLEALKVETVGLCLLQVAGTGHPSLEVRATGSEEGVSWLLQGAELRAWEGGATCHECARPLPHIWCTLSLSSLLESA